MAESQKDGPVLRDSMGEELYELLLDLPPLIESKKHLLEEKISYPTVGVSVLDKEWIQNVKKLQAGKVLFIAEGLFMYLPRERQILKLSIGIKGCGGSGRISRIRTSNPPS